MIPSQSCQQSKAFGSLELMQRALTKAADNVPYKAPYSADAFPGP